MPICCYTTLRIISISNGGLFMNADNESGGESLPLTPELIDTINDGQHNVLRYVHLSLLKKLAKSARNIRLQVLICDGEVREISHTVPDFTS
jgi:hypothetical protein